MPKIVDKKKKKSDIAHAAIRACRRLGYHRTRMADIATEAQVGKGTLYEYFAGKDEILRWVFEEYFAAFRAGAAEAVLHAETPRRQLEAIVRFAFEHIRQWEDYCAVYVDYLGGTRGRGEVEVSLAHIYGDMADMLCQLIRAGQQAGDIHSAVDPAAVAELLLSTFDGIVLHGLFVDRACSKTALRDVVLHLLDLGLGTESTRPNPDVGS